MLHHANSDDVVRRLLAAYLIVFLVLNAVGQRSVFSVSHNNRKLFESEAGRNVSVDIEKIVAIVLGVIPHIFFNVSLRRDLIEIPLLQVDFRFHLQPETTHNYTRVTNISFLSKYLASHPVALFVLDEGCFTQLGTRRCDRLSVVTVHY